MKKLAPWGLAVFLISPWLCRAADAGSTVDVNVSPGWDFYQAGQYRYGPSMIINPDNSVDIWTASPGGNGQWDWIRYRHSTDGGRTWGPESVVLTATLGTADALAVCDPGVISFGGYYYLGYTSTTNIGGTDNDVFVARSTSPTGPFQKWSGTGWVDSASAHPAPIVDFDGVATDWGAGEPSFVKMGNTLYIYYTWMGGGVNQTRLATAPADDPNWPAHLTQRGTVISRVSGEDSTDVKYVDFLERFVAVSIASRFSESSYLKVRESVDGLSFTNVGSFYENLQDWAHNCGISGTPDGHLDVGDHNLFGYAYSENDTVNWGEWNTALHPITVPEPAALMLLAAAGVFLLFLRAVKTARSR